MIIYCKFNINLVVKHIAGKDNVYADALSRWQYYNVIRVLKTCMGASVS